MLSCLPWSHQTNPVFTWLSRGEMGEYFKKVQNLCESWTFSFVLSCFSRSVDPFAVEKLYNELVDFETGDALEFKKGSTQARGAQQNAQQWLSVRLLSRFGCASVSVISLYLASINHLLTSTYKGQSRTENPLLFLLFDRPTFVRSQQRNREFTCHIALVLATFPPVAFRP